MTEQIVDLLTRVEDRVTSVEKQLFELKRDFILLKCSNNPEMREKLDDLGEDLQTALHEVNEDITKRLMEKLRERGVDERCLDFWRTHGNMHSALLSDVENEKLPPNRDENRDESPYWMHHLKIAVQKLQSVEQEMRFNSTVTAAASVAGGGGISATGLSGISAAVAKEQLNQYQSRNGEEAVREKAGVNGTGSGASAPWYETIGSKGSSKGAGSGKKDGYNYGGSKDYWHNGGKSDHHGYHNSHSYSSGSYQGTAKGSSNSSDHSWYNHGSSGKGSSDSWKGSSDSWKGSSSDSWYNTHGKESAGKGPAPPPYLTAKGGKKGETKGGYKSLAWQMEGTGVKDTTIPSNVLQGTTTYTVLQLLQKRGCDQRVIDYYAHNNDYHREMLSELENENLPPGRDPHRDESPFWMSLLKSKIHGARYGGGSGGKKIGEETGSGAKSRERSRSREGRY